jgi:hypothetical protein
MYLVINKSGEVQDTFTSNTKARLLSNANVGWRTLYAAPDAEIVCAQCGEGTASNSMKGLVHVYGPTSHAFKPKVVKELRQ